MKDTSYDSSRPLARLEKGDKAIIRVGKFPFANNEDKEKYKNVPYGAYEAICVEPYRLKCEEYPVLSGRYTYWRGNKWGCTENIYADELNPIGK